MLKGVLVRRVEPTSAASRVLKKVLDYCFFSSVFVSVINIDARNFLLTRSNKKDFLLLLSEGYFIWVLACINLQIMILPGFG